MAGTGQNKFVFWQTDNWCIYGHSVKRHFKILQFISEQLFHTENVENWHFHWSTYIACSLANRQLICAYVASESLFGIVSFPGTELLDSQVRMEVSTGHWIILCSVYAVDHGVIQLNADFNKCDVTAVVTWSHSNGGNLVHCTFGISRNSVIPVSILDRV